MKLSRKIGEWFAILCLVGVVTFTFVTLAAAETTFERVKRTGKISIGYSNAPPFCFTDANGNVTGYGPEVFKAITKKLGVKIEKAVLTEWAGLIPGLLAGRYDVIAASMFVTPKRCKQVIFTDPDYKLGSAFLVKKGNPKNLHSYADVAKHPKAILSVLAGAVEHDYARKEGIPDSRILVVNDLSGHITAVKSGRADAAAETSVAIQVMAEKGGPEVEVADPFSAPLYTIGYGALAFQKEDKDLRDWFNKAMQEFIGTKEHLAVIKPFGWTKTNLPGGKTAAECCAGK